MSHPNGPLWPSEPPRVAPSPIEQMRPEWVRTLERIPGAGLKGRYFPAHVLGCLMQSPEVFGPFLEYWVASKKDLSFSVREQELVILRMAVKYRSEYVWKHHIPVAREFGITEPEIHALRETVPPATFIPRERMILLLIDSLFAEGSIPTDLWSRASALLTPREVVDLIHLFSQYVLFALTNNALQVAVEPALGELPGLGA